MHNVSGGVIVSNQSLVLQRVELRNAGEFVCAADNDHGAGRSNTVDLRVKCE